MCFSQEMSASFAAFGVLLGIWTWTQTRNKSLLAGILYFVTMETLQAFQYIWIDQCDLYINKVLTVFGFLHICFQPYFTHVLTGAFSKGTKLEPIFKVIRKMAVIQGIWMFARFVLAMRDEQTLASALLSDECPNTEWLRAHSGPQALCTFKGNAHLAWSLPLTAPTYWMPSNFIHFFMMFVPFFVTGVKSLWVQGALLCLGGPFLSTIVTDNLYEQASIWCFFSILQITLAVFVSKFALPHKVWARNKIAYLQSKKEAALKKKD
ncbi:MAG: hypothetical protein MHM6MM_002935 [Cercozoa sp. M6MM]